MEMKAFVKSRHRLAKSTNRSSTVKPNQRLHFSNLSQPVAFAKFPTGNSSVFTMTCVCECERYRTIIVTQDAIPENKTKTSPRAINTYTLSEIRDRKIFSFFARQDATTVDFAHSCETRRGLFSNPSRCRQARPAVTDQTNDRLGRRMDGAHRERTRGEER